jgi:lipopolysaccharide/colanic/teichoic acid biosynthesis glycosyltransferase/glycosyltransferase involved in cell wall biosynthesis
MISVIVPAYDAEATIGDCVRALQQQSLASDTYEIIVADDGSTDATPTIARQLGATVVSNPHQGKSAARNAGAAAACGDLLLFTDSDCAPSSDWIEGMSAPFANSDVMGVKGAYRTRQHELIARFVQIESEDKYDRMSKETQIDFIDTYSAAYRRDIFILNGGFDTRLKGVEDQDLSFRLAHKGYRLVFVPSATVYHRHKTTVWGYFRRKFDIGYWKAILTTWYPDKAIRDSHTRQVTKFQIGVVGCMLASLPLFLLAWNTVWLEAGLILLFALSTLPFAAKASRKDWQIGLLAPPLLFVCAAALGMGLLAGFVRHGRSLSASQKVLSAPQMMVKRGLDVSIGLVVIACCLPLWAVIAMLIKLDSRGPVFFVQRRVGENGRIFNCYKFRTMVDGAETLSTNIVRNEHFGSAVLKVPNDPRRTRVGKVLRRTSLDETPNLINVLRGEMSLVGPRPEEVPVVSLYSDWHRKRLAVKPGITGPMQINGRGALTLDERVQLELDYIEHYSLTRDLLIMLWTIPAVIRGQGAY